MTDVELAQARQRIADLEEEIKLLNADLDDLCKELRDMRFEHGWD